MIDSSVVVQHVDVPGKGRFILASKITQNPNTTWHYEYALYNFNSDRSAQSFRVPLPAGVQASNIGFHDVWYHDEDAIYSGADWSVSCAVGEVRWSSETYAQNVNANALRWGTMYNFWFDSDSATGRRSRGNQPLQAGVRLPASVCAGRGQRARRRLPGRHRSQWRGGCG